ncbi:MAG: T9SS type A sorting domain-containing protein [Bacteroidota bacterium]
MKNISIVVFLVLVTLSVKSQVDSTIYGISANTAGSGLFLGKIDPVSGSVSNISINSVPWLSGSYGRTLDPQHHKFYFTPDSVLLCFGLASGNLIYSKQIINIPGTQFYGMIYNCRDTLIYGLSVNVTGQQVFLSKLNQNSGYIEQISTSSVSNSYRILTGTALDPNKEIFYFETSANPPNNLIGVDLQTGLKVIDTLIGLAPGERFGPIVFNCRDSVLYGLSGNATVGRKLAKIDPSSGGVTILSQSIIANTILFEPVTLDPFNQIYYFLADDNTYRGVSLQTGAIVTQPVVTPVSGTYFSNYVFNHTCYFDIPTGIEKISEDSEIKLFPNPANDDLYVNSGVPISKIEILSASGKILFFKDLYGITQFILPVANLNAGLYIIRVQCKNSIHYQKFVKK